ncbi:MAG: PD-(D/E)XK nuclease family transposase, partial [Bacteroidales bacterium]|nr:PD-(D/E)XK nuclease family transposase [Bacteroidales bacterium]
MGRFVNPFTDVGFKIVFGQEISKPLLLFTLPDMPEFRTDVVLMDTKTKSMFSDDIKMTFLQLPLFNKEEAECETVFEKWIYIFKNMNILERM